MDQVTETFLHVSEQVKQELEVEQLESLTLEDVIRIREDPQLEYIHETHKELIIFESTLEFSKNKFKLVPSEEDWWKTFEYLLDDYAMDQLINFKEIADYALKSDVDKQQYDFGKTNVSFYDSEEEDSLRNTKMNRLKSAFSAFFTPIRKMLEHLNGQIHTDLKSLSGFYKDIKNKRFDNEKLNVGVFKKYIEINKKLSTQLNELFKRETLEIVGFSIKTADAKESSISKLETILNSTFDLIVSNNVYLISKMEEDSKVILNTLAKKPATVEEYKELKEFTEKLNDELSSIWLKIEIVCC